MSGKIKKKTRKKSVKNNKKTNSNFIIFLRDQNGMVKKIYIFLFVFVFISCSIIIISYMSRGYLDNYVKTNIVEEENIVQDSINTEDNINIKQSTSSEELSQPAIVSRAECLNRGYGWCNGLGICMLNEEDVCDDGESVKRRASVENENKIDDPVLSEIE